MIIAISGKIGSGKDTIGNIIHYLVSIHQGEGYNDSIDYSNVETGWKTKKFADSLKDIVCILLGCTRKQLEDREFKEKELGEEWWYYGMGENNNTYTVMIPYLESAVKGKKDHDRYLVKLTPRKLLQLIGTECGRNIIHPNIWVNALMSGYKPTGKGVEDKMWSKTLYHNSQFPNWIITDMRFPNELKAVKDRGGIAIRVNRNITIKDNKGQTIKNNKSYSNISTIQHPSETALDTAEFDYTIDNNSSIVDLIIKVKKILIKEEII